MSRKDECTKRACSTKDALLVIYKECSDDFVSHDDKTLELYIDIYHLRRVASHLFIEFYFRKQDLPPVSYDSCLP
jgi:hypothetical protein